MGPASHPGREAVDFVPLVRALTAPVGTRPTLHEIVVQATRLVPARWAAALVADRITATPATLAATTDDSVTEVIARIAGAAGTSPGWQAFDDGIVCHVPDLRAEQGFGTYPGEMVAQTPVRAVLSVPLTGRTGIVGVLTLYADQPHAFGPSAVERAVLLGTHAGIALATADANDRAANLERALLSSRTIGAAVGVLVERHRLTEALAFDVLRHSSQLTNRKLADVAADLVASGKLAQEEQALARSVGESRPQPRSA